nr:NADH dehydrogenase subunit 2 [Actornithophilus gracilis]
MNSLSFWGHNLVTTFLLMFIYFFSCLALISSSKSFWIFWVSLELMNFFFIPWLSYGEKLNMKVKVFNYFVIQGISSGLFLIGISLMEMGSVFFTLLIISMLIKLGAFPFHSWMLKVSEMMGFEKFTSMMTWVKLAPLSGLSFLPIPLPYMTFFTLGVFASWGGYMVNSIRILVVYSSVAHSSWLLLSLYLSKVCVCVYLMSYWLLLYGLSEYVKVKSVNKLTDLLVVSSKDFFIYSILFGMMALPPFLGFSPKILILSLMNESSLVMEMILILSGSLVPLYFYLKTVYFFFLSLSMKSANSSTSWICYSYSPWPILIFSLLTTLSLLLLWLIL